MRSYLALEDCAFSVDEVENLTLSTIAKIELILRFFYRMMNSEPVKKRSKLVLPAPQISDAELEEVISKFYIQGFSMGLNTFQFTKDLAAISGLGNDFDTKGDLSSGQALQDEKAFFLRKD